MSMRGVDVSHWQEGIDLSALDCDFVICKATQGTGYGDPACAEHVEAALSSGKPAGVYHYIDGGGAAEEAAHFLDAVGDWLGEVVLFLDWESEGNEAWGDEEYLREVARAVADGAGAAPMIYASKSVFPWDVAEEQGFGRWVAQYADDEETGFQDSPWNEGAYECEVRQYSSHGRIDGYDGDIDLDKAYIDADVWAAWARGEVCDADGGGDAEDAESAGAIDDAPSGSAAELAAAVMEGDYGDGDARKEALGGRYEEVQALINAVAAASVDELAQMVLAGELGDGDVRKAILGGRYDVVQAIVNEALGASWDVEALARAVIAGEYGDGDARKEALGSIYQAVQDAVNEMVG